MVRFSTSALLPSRTIAGPGVVCSGAGSVVLQPGAVGALVVVLLLVPDHVFGVGEGRIRRRIARSLAGWQTRHHVVRRAIEEERYGVTLAAGAVDHAVRRRQEAVVGPAPQHVAAVDQEMAVPRRCVDPLARAGADRQT